MARIAAAGVLFIGAWGLASCAELRSPVNAPWHIDVQRPPSPYSVENGVPERPQDPGEIVGVVSYGLLGALGATSRGRSPAYEGGVELSVHGGVSRVSEGDLIMGISQQTLGLNIGWMATSRSGRNRHQSDRGLLYGELQATSSLFWLASGWGVALADRASGPQVTAGAGPLYLRYAYLPEGGGSVLLGLVFKGRVEWTRVRH